MNEVKQMLFKYLEGVKEELEENGDTWELLEDALDFEVTRLVSTGEVSQVTVTLTIGGPNVFLKAGRALLLEGYWGSNECELFVENDELLNGLFDYAEAVSV